MKKAFALGLGMLMLFTTSETEPSFALYIPFLQFPGMVTVNLVALINK